MVIRSRQRCTEGFGSNGEMYFLAMEGGVRSVDASDARDIPPRDDGKEKSEGASSVGPIVPGLEGNRRQFQ